MRIDIITVLPELLESPFNHSIIKRAISHGIAEIHLHDLRNYSEDKHKRVDDYSFSKGAGMVMTIQPIEKVITMCEEQYNENVYPDVEERNKLVDQCIEENSSSQESTDAPG